MKQIFICYHVFEIKSESTASIPRLIASVIKELEAEYAITFTSFCADYDDPYIKTKPDILSISPIMRLWRYVNNKVRPTHRITQLELQRRTTLKYIRNCNKNFDIIIVLGLDDVALLRSKFSESKIVYWIHGISAIFNKNYLNQINKVDYLWSPTDIIYKRIVEELLPTALLSEYQKIPNWCESYFHSTDDVIVNEIRSKYDIQPNAKVFIFCGGENKLKGWFLLKRALKTVAETTNDSFTVIVTGGAVQSEEVFSGRVRIIYTGSIHPKLLAFYYRVAKFGFFPSLGGYEHAPVTIIEMIASDIIPIASDVGGIKEMIGKDYSYFVDIPHSVDMWAAKINELISTTTSQQNILLSYLKNSMQAYQRKDFSALMQSIVKSELD